MAEVTFIEQGHEILGIYPDSQGIGPHDSIATAARTCYRSKPSGEGANRRLTRTLINRGHEAMIEFGWMMVRFTCDRGVSHELVRHRHFSFAMESQRYVNSTKKGFEFILPEGLTEEQEITMKASCIESAQKYEALTSLFEATPEVARSVLPNATATRICVGGNLRSWREMFKLRVDIHAHLQMRKLMIPLLKELKERIPIIFDDIDIED